MHGIKPNTHLSILKSNHDAGDEDGANAKFTRDTKPQHDHTKFVKHNSGNLLADVEKQISDWHSEMNVMKK